MTADVHTLKEHRQHTYHQVLDCCPLSGSLQDRNLPYTQRVAKKLDIRAVEPTSGDDNELTMDLAGVDASIANALRRILLAEVRCPECDRSAFTSPTLITCSRARRKAAPCHVLDFGPCCKHNHLFVTTAVGRHYQRRDVKHVSRLSTADRQKQST